MGSDAGGAATAGGSGQRKTTEDARKRRLRLKWSSQKDAFEPLIHREEQQGSVALSAASAMPVAILGLFILAVGYTSYLIQPVLVPVILAWVVGTILMPVIEWLEERGLPRVVSALVTAFSVLFAVLFVLVLLTVPLAFWVGRASELGALIKQKLDTLNEPLRFLSELGRTISEVTSQGQGPALRVEQGNGGIVSSIFSTLTPAVTQFILFFGALIFYLIYRDDIRTSIVRLVRERSARLTVLRVLTDVEDNMTIYFGTFTIVNVCLGVATALVTWACGLPNPLLWGVLAAVFNYVPYVGPALTTGTLFVAGLLSFPTLYPALVAPAIYVAMTTIEGHFITPTIIGHRLTMNPFLVFLSIAFWTWLWGPIGAFLAVPLVMTGKILIRHAFPQDQPALPE